MRWVVGAAQPGDRRAGNLGERGHRVEGEARAGRQVGQRLDRPIWRVVGHAYQSLQLLKKNVLEMKQFESVFGIYSSE